MHDDWHWAYDQRGWLIRWRNRRTNPPKSRFDAAAEYTPPGHERYISPVEMQKKSYYLKQIEELKKARLHKDEACPEGG